MTFVFLSIHTFALEDMRRAVGRLATEILDVHVVFMVAIFVSSLARIVLMARQESIRNGGLFSHYHSCLTKLPDDEVMLPSHPPHRSKSAGSISSNQQSIISCPLSGYQLDLLIITRLLCLLFNSTEDRCLLRTD
jgi:hypothetical protein